MFKYEKTAKVGEYIKAYNFKPCPDRQDQFIVGKVVGKYKKTPFGFAAYEVKLMHRTMGNAGNEFSFVPFETTNDYEGRIIKLSQEEGRSYA